MERNKVVDIVERQAKIQAQEEYCTKHHLPNFVGNGRCYGCGINVFDYVPLKEAESGLITGCPRCHKSFCD